MQKSAKSICLNGEWVFAQTSPGLHQGNEPSPPDLSGAEWLTGRLPGTVQCDLVRLGRVPDPFVDLNANQLLWIEERDWWYRRRFAVPADFVQDRGELVFEGLDLFASVYLNGCLIGQHANMFTPSRLDVGQHLRTGAENEILIHFQAPLVKVAGQDASKLVGPFGVPERRLMRKAQFGYGWDWTPRVATVGPWRPARIDSYRGACVRGIWARALPVGAVTGERTSARVEATIEVESFGPAASPANMDLSISLEGTVVANRSLMVSIQPGLNQLSASFDLPEARLWWPNGLGERPLYTLRARILQGAECLDEQEATFGVREIRLLQEPAEGGTGFVFQVNGAKVFCKGANWSPSDLLTLSSRREVYEDILGSAAEAHFNMLRVNGVGIYEDPAFYDICDRLGILVWQDFCFSCAGYPDSPEFLAEVRQEATWVVRSLRNHPCIALWCGCNECQRAYKGLVQRGEARGPLPGEQIFEKLLPSVCAQEDPDRQYRPGTPYGGVDPDSCEEGTAHTYYTMVAPTRGIRLHDDHAKFVAEFGAYFSVPEQHTLERFLTPAQRSLTSPALAFRHWPPAGPAGRGNRHFVLNLEGMFGVTEEQVGFDEAVRYARLVLGEVLKDGFEHYRRRKFDCGGALFWCLNSVWPSIDFAVVDYYGERSAGYYYAKRACAPILVSFKRVLYGAEVWVTSDRLEELRGVLMLRYATFLGETLWERSLSVGIPANGSCSALRIDFRDLPPARDAWQEFIAAELLVPGEPASENVLFFRSLREVRPPIATPGAEVVSAARGRARVRISSDWFARNVCLRLPGARFDDNYFHVLPGQAKEVTLRTDRALGRQIEVSALNARGALQLELPA